VVDQPQDSGRDRLRAGDEEAFDLAGDRQTERQRRCRGGDDQFSRSLVWRVATDPRAALGSFSNLKAILELVGVEFT
jgi:hypothetical protein